MYGTVIQMAGPAVVWDPRDPGAFTALAGDRFLRVDGDDAVVRGSDGLEQRVHPGWVAIAVEVAGGEAAEPGDVLFATAERVILGP